MADSEIDSETRTWLASGQAYLICAKRRWLRQSRAVAATPSADSLDGLAYRRAASTASSVRRGDYNT